NSALKTWIQNRRTFLLNQLATVAASFAVTSNGGNNFSTNRNYLAISGTAPIGVKTITINDIAYPLIWTTVSNWTASIALGAGANLLTIAGYDLRGNPVTNSTDTITITYTGTAETPQGHVAINEIMYNPLVADASFIELYNTSTVNAFDLSGFRLDGADFVFPGGSIIQPNGFVVIANDAAAFAAAYGSSIPLAGEFNGKLSNGGETLKLVRPGATPEQDLIIDQVTYGSDPPWPSAANGFGPSLQLIDPLLDNNRVANWAVATTNTSSSPQWQFVIVTGTASSSRLYGYLQAAGDVFVDDIQLVAGSVPAAGQNYLQNGDFESALSGPWNLTANTANSSIGSATKHSGMGSLHLVCNTGGSTVGDSMWQDMGPLVTNATYTLSYWYLPKTNGGTLTLRLSGSGVRSDQNIDPLPIVTGTQFTPGTANSVKTALAPLPLLWVNEVQAKNVT